MLRRPWPWMLGLALTGCSMPAYVGTAYHGDLPTLQKEIRAAAAAGRIGEPEVVELSEAVARRELRSARAEALTARIERARGCVRALEPELRELAEGTGDAAARALLVLSEGGRLSRGSLVERHAGAESGAFRAVAARWVTDEDHAALRRTFIVDPDERVRREALRAAFEAADPADVAVLVSAARLDPAPMNRSLATRALGAVGGDAVVVALSDLHARADRPTQLAIMDAWAAPRVRAAGGERELVRIAETAGSLPAVIAAGHLAGGEGDGARVGRAVLSRFVGEGTAEERMLAIQLAPLGDDGSVAALAAAALTDDAAVRVVALARLLEVPARRAAATAELRKVAAGTDGAARQARLALAAAKDASVAPLLERDLSHTGPSYRERAALSLLRLGKAASMAPALADPDPAVRMSVACSVLAPGRTGG